MSKQSIYVQLENKKYIFLLQFDKNRISLNVRGLFWEEQWNVTNLLEGNKKPAWSRSEFALEQLYLGGRSKLLGVDLAVYLNH